MQKRRTDVVVLTLLRIGPMTGYQIRDACRTRMTHFWSESFGQIYPTLKRLLVDGHIDHAENQEGRGSAYRITASGLDKLADWLKEPVAARSVRDELFLKLLGGTLAGAGVPIAHIQQARREAEHRLASAQAGIEALVALGDAVPDSTHWKLVGRAGELHAKAMLEWCDEAEAALTRDPL
ncbi:MAG: PadR family transcriptional regulator [Pseudomonadota bacterium]